MRLRLIDDIDRLFHFSTTRIALLGTALAMASPLLQVWDMIPDTAKAFLPDTWKAAVPLVIIFATLIFARATTTEPHSADSTDQK